LSGWEECSIAILLLVFPSFLVPLLMLLASLLLVLLLAFLLYICVPVIASDLAVADNDITTLPMQHCGPLFSVNKAILQGFEKSCKMICQRQKNAESHFD
jgi:hypothetical protein